MYYFLAHFPKIDFSQINEIRKKYDPNYGFIEPHITLVFPTDASIGKENLLTHIEDVVMNWKPFSISLSGLEKSWDDFLYIPVQEGRNQITSLHDNLYSGILSPFWRKDIPYTPHTTLGVFSDIQTMSDRAKALDDATVMAQSMNIDIHATFDSVALIQRRDKQSPARIVQELFLKD